MRDCSRNGCDKIGCMRYSKRYGYICQECFDDLVKSGPMTEIFKFMTSPKPKPTDIGESKARYNYVFGKD